MRGLTTKGALCIKLALDRRYFVTKGSVATPTHYLMDKCHGGVLAVEESMYDEFMEMYATDALVDGKHLYLSEQRSPVFRMHFDVDGVVLTAEQRVVICALIQEVVVCFYKELSPEARRLYVCDTSRSDGLEPNFKVAKTNLHIMLPFLYVDSERALYIARACIFRATLAVPHIPWRDVIDLQVYTTNGLRMIGSRKCDKCPKCGDKPVARSSCVHCEFTGVVDMGRYYDLCAVIGVDGQNDDEELARCRANSVSRAKLCSVRCKPGTALTEGFTLYEGCSKIDDMALSVRPIKMPEKGELLDHLLKHGAEDKKAGSKRARKKDNDMSVEPGDFEYSVISSLVRNFAPQYKKLVVKSIVTQATKRVYFTVNVEGDGAQFCHNVPLDSAKKGYHSRTSVYFIVSSNAISQQCRSTKAGQRLKGVCSSFKHRKQISEQASTVLFPHMHSLDLTTTFTVSDLYAMRSSILYRLQGDKTEKKKPKVRRDGTEIKPIYNLF